MDELLRGDPEARARTWRTLREIGAVNANEIRRQEGWNPRGDPAGNEFLSPLNMNSGLRSKQIITKRDGTGNLTADVIEFNRD